MYCPEHLIFKAFGERVYLWLYWHDVPPEMIPLRVWMNPLRYELFIRAFGRVVKINPHGRWALTVPATLRRWAGATHD
jgi:hypothetical protein